MPAMSDVEGSQSHAFGIGYCDVRLPGSRRMCDECNGSALRPKRLQSGQRIALVRMKLDLGAVLTRQNIAQRTSGYLGLQKQAELLDGSSPLRRELVIRPAVNTPTLVDQAILPSQIVSILLGANQRRAGVMEYLAVDLEFIAAKGRDQGVVDRAD